MTKASIVQMAIHFVPLSDAHVQESADSVHLSCQLSILVYNDIWAVREKGAWTGWQTSLPFSQGSFSSPHGHNPANLSWSYLCHIQFLAIALEYLENRSASFTPSLQEHTPSRITASIETSQPIDYQQQAAHQPPHLQVQQNYAQEISIAF